MAATRYKFIKIEAHGSEVFAIFKISTAGPMGIFEVFFKPKQVHLKEKMCKEIYQEACANSDRSKGGYTSSSSKEDAKKAYLAIRAYKTRHGIPFDYEAPVQTDQFGNAT